MSPRRSVQFLRFVLHLYVYLGSAVVQCVLLSVRQSIRNYIIFSLQILFCSSNEGCVRCTVGGPSLAGVSDVSICDACNEENYVIVRINPNNLAGDSLIVSWVCMYSCTGDTNCMTLLLWYGTFSCRGA